MAVSDRPAVPMLPPSRSWSTGQALDYARQEELDEVLIVGSSDGALVVRSSAMSTADAVFLLEKAMRYALDV